MTSQAVATQDGERPFRVLSFGAGVQTVALLYLWVFDSVTMPIYEPTWKNFKGFFGGEKPDLVIFADTQAEPKHVYDAVEDAKGRCEDAGIPFEVVTRGNLARPPKTKSGVQKIFVPVYTRDLTTGEKGQMQRQCTAEYKVRPVTRRAKQLAAGRPIEMTLGISLDEAHRMKRRDAADPVQNAYPLVISDYLPEPMTRTDCVQYLIDSEQKAAKSACSFCPYRRDPWWAWMYRNDPESYAQAVAYDRWVRDKRPGFECYVHESLRPLEDVVPGIVAAEDAQTSLFPMTLDMAGSGGCEEGFCGV